MSSVLDGLDYHETILSLVGRTPLVRLRKLAQNCPAPVLAKLEYFTLAALDTTTVRARLQTLGMVAIGRNSRDSRANYDANFPMQEKLIKGLGIRLD